MVLLALLAVAFVGRAMRAPSVITNAAALISLAGMLFLIPAWYLTALLLEDGIAPRGASWLALRHMPWMLFSGPLVLIVGLILVASPTVDRLDLRVAGAIAVAWGGLVICTGVMALCKKRRMRNATRA